MTLSKDLETKISSLEEDLQDIVLGDTRIDWNCLSEQERILHRYADKIIHTHTEETVHLITKEEWQVLHKSTQLIHKWSLQLWLTSMEHILMLNTDARKIAFSVAFSHFISELKDLDRAAENIEYGMDEKNDEEDDPPHKLWKEHIERCPYKTQCKEMNKC